MATTSHSLAGCRVAITGAARGIGKATARALHERGATVVIGDLDLDVAQQAAAEIGQRVSADALDVTNTESFQRFLDHARESLGGLDVLVNNAGIMPIGPFLEQTETLVRRAVEINVLGPILGMRLALPAMLEQGHGHIVNVASSAGLSALPGGVNYCATKAAVITMTEGARLEFGPRGIDFTVVLPAFTNTDLVSGTTAPKAVPMVEPEVVATAIADALTSKTSEVYIPKALKAMIRAQGLLPRRLRDHAMRTSGSLTTFLDIDPAQRRDYDERIARS